MVGFLTYPYYFNRVTLMPFQRLNQAYFMYLKYHFDVCWGSNQNSQSYPSLNHAAADLRRG